MVTMSMCGNKRGPHTVSVTEAWALRLLWYFSSFEFHHALWKERNKLYMAHLIIFVFIFTEAAPHDQRVSSKCTRNQNILLSIGVSPLWNNISDSGGLKSCDLTPRDVLYTQDVYHDYLLGLGGFLSAFCRNKVAANAIKIFFMMLNSK